MRGAAGLPEGRRRDLTPPQGGPSVVILRVAFLRQGFPVMALLAELLPVVLVPEEVLISAVGDDVVDNSSFDVPSVPFALDTQRMFL